MPDPRTVALMLKRTPARVLEMPGGFSRIVRVIPDAPAIGGNGFSPVMYPAELSAEEDGAPGQVSFRKR